jgi:hypothetical protein
MTTHSIDSLQQQKGFTKTPDAGSKILDEDIRSCLDDDLFLHQGDLAVDGNFAPGSGRQLIVDGNLTVTGWVATDETETLVVTGDLTCQHLYLEGNFEVQGNVTATGLVYGFYEAGISFVYGRTTARIGLIGNHAWECDDEQYDVVGKFSNYHQLEEGDPKTLRTALGDRVFNALAPLMGISEAAENDESEKLAWHFPDLCKHLEHL